MKCYYDLHIHSCLSPCGDMDMTPNNIVNMAVLKGLQIIAVADHNATGNLKATMAVGQAAGLLVVPAMELCTSEEIHLLCLFPTVEAAETVSALLYQGMDVPDNRPDIFGRQLLLDENDEPIGEDPRMLLSASVLDVSAALEAVRAVGGVAVPAHVDRDAYSMLATLGAIPREYGFRVVELADEAASARVAEVAPGCRRLINSDAHYLWNIAEPEQAIELPEPGVEALLTAIREGRGLLRL